MPDKGGKIPYNDLKQYERQAKVTPEELIPPVEFPKMLSYIWSAFIQLSERRPQGFNGPLPISYEQIHSWKILTDQVLKPRDIDAILAVDRAYMKVYNGRH